MLFGASIFSHGFAGSPRKRNHIARRDCQLSHYLTVAEKAADSVCLSAQQAGPRT